MKNKLFLISILFIIAIFQSCRYSSDKRSEKAEEMLAEVMKDSLSREGKHGYFAINYIVGRLKKTPMSEGLPFKVTVTEINRELLEEEIHFKISDSLHYTISYPENETEGTKLRGEFGKPLVSGKINLTIYKLDQHFPRNSQVMETLKMIDYLFKVHKY